MEHDGLSIGPRYMYPVQIPLNAQEYSALAEYCKQHGMKRTQVIRKALHALVGDQIRPSVRAMRNTGAYRMRDYILDQYLQGTAKYQLAKEYGITQGALHMLIRQAQEERGIKIGFNEDVVKANQEICRRVLGDPFISLGGVTRTYMETIAQVGQAKAPAILGVSRQRVAQIVVHAKRLAGVPTRIGSRAGRPRNEVVQHEAASV